MRSVKSPERVVRSVSAMQPSLSESLASLRYPITKDAAMDHVGRLPLQTEDQELDVVVGHILQGVPTRTFDDARQAEQAIFERWERFSRSLGAVEQARRSRLEEE